MDDVVDSRYIETASCDISCQKDGIGYRFKSANVVVLGASLLEQKRKLPIKVLQPLPLFELRVQGKRLYVQKFK